MRVLFQTTLLLSMFVSLESRAEPPIEGRYWTEDKKGIVELYRAGSELRGRVLWRAEPLLDENNPDPNLRGRSMIGATFLSGFTQADSSWQHGSVYSADNGRTYRGKLWLEDNGQVLKMRGYVGLSLFGRTASFQRLSLNESVPTEY